MRRVDIDINTLVFHFVEEKQSVRRIATTYKMGQKRLATMLLDKLGQHVFRAQIRVNRSHLVNDPEFRRRADETWKRNNPDWQPPAKDPAVAAKISATKKNNPRYDMSHHWGDRKGKGNGRYKPLTNEVEQRVIELFDEGLSLEAIGAAIGIRQGRVLTSLVYTHGKDRDRLLAARTTNKKSYPEYLFETRARLLDIETVYQYPLKPLKGRERNYDFFLPRFQTLIEIDSKSWHDYEWCVAKGYTERKLLAVVNNIANDRFKNQLAASNNLQLMRFTVFTNEIFDTYLKSLLDGVQNV